MSHFIKGFMDTEYIQAPVTPDLRYATSSTSGILIVTAATETLTTLRSNLADQYLLGAEE